MSPSRVLALILTSISLLQADSDSLLVNLTIHNNSLDWCNLQEPGNASITFGSNLKVTARVYDEFLTNQPGAHPDISAWIGYCQHNTAPSNPEWTWLRADFIKDIDNHDEYGCNIGIYLKTPGKYYLASRFALPDSLWVYGGYNHLGGGFWDGNTSRSSEITVLDSSSFLFTSNSLPKEYLLYSPFPNPFNNVTIIRFDLPEKIDVQIAIFDLQGQLVRSWNQGSLHPGQYQLIWNGTNQQGIKITSGCYLLLMQTTNTRFTKKVLLLK